MPALPWTQVAPPPSDGDVLVLASRLRLRRFRDVPGFLRHSMRVNRAVREVDGAIGVSLDAKPLRRTFLTLSTWTDEAAMRRLVTHPVHRDVMARYRDRLVDPTFVTWTVPAGSGPPRWSDALAHLDGAPT
jgi:heme-degrading monooxygenase HmoA